MRFKQLTNKLLALLPMAVFFFLVGCAGGDLLQGPRGALSAARSVPENEGLLVFLRERGSNNRAANLTVNDQEVGALLPERYAVTRACAGSVKAAVADRTERTSVPRYQPVSLASRKIVYLELSEGTDGKFLMKQIEAQTAQEKLPRLILQSHVINRYVPDCTSASPSA